MAILAAKLALEQVSINACAGIRQYQQSIIKKNMRL